MTSLLSQVSTDALIREECSAIPVDNQGVA